MTKDLINGFLQQMGPNFGPVLDFMLQSMLSMFIVRLQQYCAENNCTIHDLDGLDILPDDMREMLLGLSRQAAAAKGN